MCNQMVTSEIGELPRCGQTREKRKKQKQKQTNQKNNFELQTVKIPLSVQEMFLFPKRATVSTALN